MSPLPNSPDDSEVVRPGLLVSHKLVSKVLVGCPLLESVVHSLNSIHDKRLSREDMGNSIRKRPTNKSFFRSLTEK